jgi:hypothetical protein
MILGLLRLAAVALLAAGCYRSTPPAAPGPEPVQPIYYQSQATYAHARFQSARQVSDERSLIAQAIAKLGNFADDMCACTDKTCADQVSQEMTRWSTEMSKEYSNSEDFRPTEEEMEEAQQVTERLSKCMMTAMGYGNPSPPTP